MAKFKSMSSKPGMNALNTDFTQPGAGLAQTGVTLQNLHQKWNALYKDRANKKGGSKQLYDNLVRWTTTPNAQHFVKTNPQQAALFQKSVETGVIQPGLTPQTMAAALDWGIRENDRSQQHKSNFLDSTFGKILGKLMQVGVAFIPGVGTPMAMALGAGLGAAQAAGQTRTDAWDIAKGGLAGAAAGAGGEALQGGIDAAGGFSTLVRAPGTFASNAGRNLLTWADNGVANVQGFLNHPLQTLAGTAPSLTGTIPTSGIGRGLDMANQGISVANPAKGIGTTVLSHANGAGSTGSGVTNLGSGGNLIDGRTGQVISGGNAVANAAGNGMDWTDLLSAGTNILGTIFDNGTNDNSADAVRYAAELQKQARAEARADYEKAYGRVTDINKPGVGAYNDAVGVLDPLLTKGQVKVRGRNISADQWLKTVDPGYKFRFNEGQRALSTRQSAAGDRLSGRASKELLRYGQGYASNEFGNSVQRLQNLAVLGNSAVGRVSNAAEGVGSADANLALLGGETNSKAAIDEANLAGANRTNWVNSGNNIASSLIDRYRRSASGSQFIGR